MGLIISVLSVINEENERICKFCYGEEGSDVNWLHPCRCIGTLYWVHYKCFELWMSRASAEQQLQCQTCRYVYQRNWVLKSYSEWCLPKFDLNAWQWLEMFLDFYSTYKFIRGIIWTIEGKRSIFVQILHFFFWRTFIMSNRRISWYSSLGSRFLSSIFQINIQPFKELKELSADEDEMNHFLAEVPPLDR